MLQSVKQKKTVCLNDKSVSNIVQCTVYMRDFAYYRVPIIFILGFKSPGKILEKTLKQPWKTLDFLISDMYEP